MATLNNHRQSVLLWILGAGLTVLLFVTGLLYNTQLRENEVHTKAIRSLEFRVNVVEARIAVLAYRVCRGQCFESAPGQELE